MTDAASLPAVGAQATNLLETQTARLLARTKGEAAGAPGNADQEAKILKSSKDFESILLGSWLQQAEQSFAKVPGGEGDEDEDSGKDQFQGIAMQALAGSLAASGGIGIAKMIAGHLRGSAARAEGQRSVDRGGDQGSRGVGG